MAPSPRHTLLVAMPLFIVLAAGLGCASRASVPPYEDGDVGARLDPLIRVANEWNETDVVPNGERRPLERVFAELALDPDRFVGRRVCGGINFVAYVCFQVAPSYEMQVMTGWDDVFDSERHPFRANRRRAFSPDLLVYGIQLRRVETVP